MKATIQKWGNSLALRLPKPLAQEVQWTEGSKVELVRTAEGVLVKGRRRKPALSPRGPADRSHARKPPLGNGLGRFTRPGGREMKPPERGDLVWMDFDPQAGHEQAGRRPALVLTPARYNRLIGLLIACPVTR